MAANLNREELIARLRKVLALAKNGVGGERENAERQLNAMLKKYGFTMSDIDDASKEEIKLDFSCNDEFEMALARQVSSMVIGEFVDIYTIRGSRAKKAHIFCTKAQAVECEITYNALREAMANHFRLSYRAFIQANKVFPPSSGDVPEKDLSPKEKADLFKVLSMSQHIERTTVNKQIGKANDGE